MTQYEKHAQLAPNQVGMMRSSNKECTGQNGATGDYYKWSSAAIVQHNITSYLLPCFELFLSQLGTLFSLHYSPRQTSSARKLTFSLSLRHNL